MDPIYQKLSDNLQKVRIGKRFFTFLFFLLIAVVFWFLNALERKYTTTIDYPVRFVNFPENRKLVSEAPDALALVITSYGYNILKYKLNLGIDPYRINLKNHSLKQRSPQDSVTFYFLTEIFHNQLAAKVNAENQITDIRPDTIFLQLARMRKKMVPVRLNFEVNYADQFRKRDRIRVEPDSILISGPENIIDTITSIPNKPLEITGVKQSQELYFELLKYDDLIYSDENVKVTIPVGRFTEKNIRVDVQKRHAPDSLKFILFPGSVNVSFMVCLDDYDEIESSYFKAVVNCDSLSAEKEKLNVQLVEKPSFIYNVRVNPSKVEYIIETRE